MAGKVVGKVDRKKGYLYYVDGKGSVKESKMNRGGAKKGHKVCKPSSKHTPAKKKK